MFLFLTHSLCLENFKTLPKFSQLSWSKYSDEPVVCFHPVGVSLLDIFAMWSQPTLELSLCFSTKICFPKYLLLGNILVTFICLLPAQIVVAKLWI